MLFTQQKAQFLLKAVCLSSRKHMSRLSTFLTPAVKASKRECFSEEINVIPVKISVFRITIYVEWFTILSSTNPSHRKYVHNHKHTQTHTHIYIYIYIYIYICVCVFHPLPTSLSIRQQLCPHRVYPLFKPHVLLSILLFLCVYISTHFSSSWIGSNLFFLHIFFYPSQYLCFRQTL